MTRKQAILAPLVALTPIACACERIGGWDTDLGSDATDGPADTHVETSPDPLSDPISDPDAMDVPPSDTGPDPDAAPDPEPDYGLGMLGDPCTETSDCMGIPTSGRACLDRTLWDAYSAWVFPGGYCTVYDCSGDGDCPPDGKCVTTPYAYATNFCIKSCTASWGCRFTEGYSCAEFRPILYPGTYCVPPTP
jgi:hypothetical protein